MREKAQLSTVPYISVIIGVIVLILIGTVFFIIMEDVRSGFYEDLCDDRLNDSWSYVNDTHDRNNNTIQCKAPNGTTKRVPSIVNIKYS